MGNIVRLFEATGPRGDELFKNVYLELLDRGAKADPIHPYMLTPEGESSEHHLEATDIEYRGLRIDLDLSPSDNGHPETDLRMKMRISGNSVEEHLDAGEHLDTLVRKHKLEHKQTKVTTYNPEYKQTTITTYNPQLRQIEIATYNPDHVLLRSRTLNMRKRR